MEFSSTSMIIGLTILFVIVGVTTSVIYYFARYYVKIDHSDKELLTKKPIEYGTEDERLAALKKSQESASEVKPTETKTPAIEKPRTMGTALTSTRNSFWGKIKNSLSGKSTLENSDKELLEEILFTNDMGPQVAEVLLTKALDSASNGAKVDLQSVSLSLQNEIKNIFSIAEESRSKDLFQDVKKRAKPTVWMVVGINGAGKTTTIGKLASQAKELGLKTLIVAGDTFRAAADEQLKVWADRAGVEYHSPGNTKDPAAVSFSGVEKAKNEGFDLVIVDTAGRLHTQAHLMEELKKIKRVMTKVSVDAPHETLLVIDANSGQNALFQAKEFHQSLQLTGVIVTKLDGSSKGGVTVGVAQETKVPVRFVGIGESVSDLRPFSSDEFVKALFESEN